MIPLLIWIFTRWMKFVGNDVVSFIVKIRQMIIVHHSFPYLSEQSCSITGCKLERIMCVHVLSRQMNAGHHPCQNKLYVTQDRMFYAFLRQVCAVSRLMAACLLVHHPSSVVGIHGSSTLKQDR